MPEKNKNKKRIWWWIGGIVGVLLILICGMAFYLSARWKPLLTEKIKQGVYEGSHKLYSIDFQDIHLNLLSGSVTLDSISLVPDTAVFNDLKAIRKAPTHLYMIKVAKLRLRRIGVLTVYFKKKIEMTDIILDRPSIQMIYNKVPKRSDTLKEDSTLYQQISKTLKSIHVKAIKIVDADFDYINGSTSKPLNSIKHLNINVKDLLIDSLTQFDTSRFYYTKDISFALYGYRSVTKDKMYTMKVDTITGSASDKTILVKGFKLTPVYPDLTFSRKYKTQKDRYDLDFNSIRFNGVDFTRLNQDGSLYAKSLVIGPAKVAVFMNRELLPPEFDKGKNYPHVALKRLPIETIIDTIKIDNVDVAYTEFNPITQKRGTVYLQSLNGNILNVTNDSVRLSVKNHAVAHLNTKIMKAANLDIVIDFNLTDKNAAFSYKGNIGSLDMTVLNPLSKSLGLVQIESGNVKKAEFNVNANLQGSTGTMHFYYSNLKVTMLKEGENGTPSKEKGLLSFLANTILIKDSNPLEGEPARTAAIAFSRTPAASFFNLLWKSVFIGIRETVGIGVVPVKSPEQAHQKVEDKKDGKKEERKDRKAERKEKREERKAEKENKSN